jgi:hypothetical protein
MPLALQAARLLRAELVCPAISLAAATRLDPADVSWLRRVAR